MGFSLIGTIIAVLMLLPSMIFFTKFPPRNVPAGLKDAPMLYTMLERAGQAGCFGLLIFAGDALRLAGPRALWAVLMLICMVIYYSLWIRYVLKGQEFATLWRPVLFIPIPLAVFPVCAFGFAALWGRSLWLGAATVVLALGHCAVTWNSYKQVR
ncbi:MAG TPA: hypothetical protein VD973_05580 [Symbiobacteriaceae bacterium]|nr:hypothetical protein [Symbiobacteriaceae bacterium]